MYFVHLQKMSGWCTVVSILDCYKLRAKQLYCHMQNNTHIPTFIPPPSLSFYQLMHRQSQIFIIKGPISATLYQKSDLCIPRNGNYAALFPIPMVMYLWVIYILPGSVCLFGCSKRGISILEIYKSLTATWMWKLGDRTLWFCFGNNDVPKCHFWEYVNQNLTFILDSHQPFICSVPPASGWR